MEELCYFLQNPYLPILSKFGVSTSQPFPVTSASQLTEPLSMVGVVVQLPLVAAQSFRATLFAAVQVAAPDAGDSAPEYEKFVDEAFAPADPFGAL